MGKKKGGAGRGKAQGVELSWGGAGETTQPTTQASSQSQQKQPMSSIFEETKDQSQIFRNEAQGGRPRAVQEQSKVIEKPEEKIAPKSQKQAQQKQPQNQRVVINKEEQFEDADEQPQYQTKAKKPKKDKFDRQKVSPYQNPGDTLFENFVDKKDTRILDFYEENLQSMKTLHRYLQNDFVFKSSSQMDHKLKDARVQLNEKLLQDEKELLETEDFYREFLVNKLQKEIIVDSVINKQALGTFDKGVDGEMVPLSAALEEPEDEIGDQDIEYILNGAFDPFEDENDPQNLPETGELQNELIVEALEMLKEVKGEEIKQTDRISSIDTNQLVTQARKKRHQINLRIEEEEKKNQITTLKNKMEQHAKQKEQPQDDEEQIQSKSAEDSSSDEDFQIITKLKPDSSSALVQSDIEQKVTAQPSGFNHAIEARKQHTNLLNQLQFQDSESQSSNLGEESDASVFDIDEVLGEQVKGEKEEVWAIVDDESMENFDQWYPVADRAIVYPFELDLFQKRAVHRLEQGDCVFVSAHTSAGKTVIAEYAIALSMKHMTKTLYTSPIKALSNQKFRDFKIKFGDDVGILTGDVSINRDATVVIMTTEVLQNQVYNDTDRLQDVEWVIFDEAHYIDDPERGSVWEEVIMKLPDHISIVLLSATFKNYMEFADWVGRTKKKKVYVQCTYQRPVPLEHHLIHAEKMHEVKKGENKLDSQVVQKIIQSSKQDRKNNMSGGGQGGGGRGGGGKQKIDYKAKAIAGKQAATGKVIDKAMGGGGGGGPNSQKSGQKKFEAFFKNLRAIKAQGLLPCVVFFFSRAQVESLANEVDDKMNFITDIERKAIKEFKKKALQRLEEGDRTLPQIVSLSNLLDRGIGFHHAGMVPILKEMVEILFTDGHLKVVFATSTFAIGLNMPARSVIFTQSTKFNGEKNEILSSTEYLQMAGRAGRRGKDDKGASILCVDDNFGKIPGIDEYEEMFDNKGKDVESKLKLTYKTNLNVLNSEDQDIGSLITNSFFSNATEQKKITAVKSKKKLAPRIEKVQNIECHQCQLSDIHHYYQVLLNLQKLNVALSQESSLKPFLLHVCQILTPKHHMKKCVILKHTAATKSLGGKQIPAKYLCLILEKSDQYEMPIFYEEGESYDSQLAKSKQQDQKKPSKLFSRGQNQADGVEGGYHFTYTEIGLKDVVTYYSSEIKLDYMLMLNQNTLTQKQLKDIIKAFDTISQRSGLNSIKAKKGKNIKKIIEERKKAFDQFDKLPILKCERLVYHITQCQKLHELEEELKMCSDLLSSESNEKENDFIAKNKVLQEYKMIDADENMLFKGKVAKEVGSGDAILMTQLLFSGHLKNLTNEEMLGIFSVLVTETKAGRSHKMLETKISDNFWKACMYMESECQKLVEIECKCGVNDQEKDLTKRLNYFFYEIVYDWAKKKPFIDIKSQHPNLEEGIVIKMILNVKNYCKVFKQMSTLIGDITLATRIEEASELLEREIMKTQSLYFQ